MFKVLRCSDLPNEQVFLNSLYFCCCSEVTCSESSSPFWFSAFSFKGIDYKFHRQQACYSKSIPGFKTVDECRLENFDLSQSSAILYQYYVKICLLLYIFTTFILTSETYSTYLILKALAPLKSPSSFTLCQTPHTRLFGPSRHTCSMISHRQTS